MQLVRETNYVKRLQYCTILRSLRDERRARVSDLPKVTQCAAGVASGILTQSLVFFLPHHPSDLEYLSSWIYSFMGKGEMFNDRL